MSIGYECRVDQGAVLHLPHHAIKQKIIDNRFIREYILTYHDQWCKFAIEELGLILAPEQIIFISGWVKTSATWTATVFTRSNTKLKAGASGLVGGAGGFKVEYRRRTSSSGLKIIRNGSSAHDAGSQDNDEIRKDQCIFLSYYSIKKRPLLPTKAESVRRSQ